MQPIFQRTRPTPSVRRQKGKGVPLLDRWMSILRFSLAYAGIPGDCGKNKGKRGVALTERLGRVLEMDPSLYNRTRRTPPNFWHGILPRQRGYCGGAKVKGRPPLWWVNRRINDLAPRQGCLPQRISVSPLIRPQRRREGWGSDLPEMCNNCICAPLISF